MLHPLDVAAGHLARAEWIPGLSGTFCPMRTGWCTRRRHVNYEPSNKHTSSCFSIKIPELPWYSPMCSSPIVSTTFIEVRKIPSPTMPDPNYMGFLDILGHSWTFLGSLHLFSPGCFSRAACQALARFQNASDARAAAIAFENTRIKFMRCWWIGESHRIVGLGRICPHEPLITIDMTESPDSDILSHSLRF